MSDSNRHDYGRDPLDDFQYHIDQQDEGVNILGMLSSVNNSGDGSDDPSSTAPNEQHGLVSRKVEQHQDHSPVSQENELTVLWTSGCIFG